MLFNVQWKKWKNAEAQRQIAGVPRQRGGNRGEKMERNKLGLLGHVWCNVKGAKSAALLPHGKDGGG